MEALSSDSSSFDESNILSSLGQAYRRRSSCRSSTKNNNHGKKSEYFHAFIHGRGEDLTAVRIDFHYLPAPNLPHRDIDLVYVE